MITDMTELARRICTELSTEFPAPLVETQMRQGLAVGEEAGEFIGALRRYLGMARRTGTFEEMSEELADLLITVHLAARYLNVDLDYAVTAKAEKIFVRGWRDARPEAVTT